MKKECEKSILKDALDIHNELPTYLKEILSSV
jgi:hypothetical protein